VAALAVQVVLEAVVASQPLRAELQLLARETTEVRVLVTVAEAAAERLRRDQRRQIIRLAERAAQVAIRIQIGEPQLRQA
jgi:hypothetical protein